jgi:hypothetical protein
MRILLALLCATLWLAPAVAQEKRGADSPHSTGRTQLPAEGQMQPQGPTGPLNTTTGGAPAESPQGQTPPGMQSAPGGSDKTVVDPTPQRR